MSPTRRPTVVLRQRPWIFCHNCLPAPWGAWCACPVEIDWCFKASNILQFPSLSWRFTGIYIGVFSCPFPLGNLVWWCASVLLWNEWLKPEMTIWHVSKLPVNLAHRLGLPIGDIKSEHSNNEMKHVFLVVPSTSSGFVRNWRAPANLQSS